MILSGAKNDVQIPKATQQGILNAWTLKIKENIDNHNQNNKIQILYQQNNDQIQQNHSDQFGRLMINSQGNSRNASNVRQSSNQNIKPIEQIQISQQLSSRDYTSPIKTQPCQSNIINDPSVQQLQQQKQKRPPSQLLHILQNQKKNIRQLFAMQINNNIQQDEKNKNQMHEIKEKLLRVSQERNKKINSLIFEENRSNQNTINMINCNAILQTNISQTQIRQKTNFQDLNRNSQDFQDNKFKVFADYQSFLLNCNNNNNTNFQIQNTYQTNSYRNQLASHNSRSVQSSGQQPKLKTILKNIPSQPVLNRVIKQSLGQIQHAQKQVSNLNIIQVKRIQSREQYQNQGHKTARAIQRTQSVICTRLVSQTNSIATTAPDQSGKVLNNCQNSLFDDNTSKVICQNKSQDKIEEDLNFINLSSFTNILPSEANETPCLKNISQLNQIEVDENNENQYGDSDILSKKIRHISNPSLRKKYTQQSNLIMKNFLKKEQIPQINGRLNHRNTEFFEGIQQDNYIEKNTVQTEGKSQTDQPKRKKNKNKNNQMSLGETCKTSEGTNREGNITNQSKNHTPSEQNGQITSFMSFSEFCNYQRQQYIQKSQLLNEQTSNINLIIKKTCSCSPSKRINSYQASAIDQINNRQNQQQCKNCNTISPKLKQQNQQQQLIKPQQSITLNVSQIQINQRPSTSLQKSNQDISINKLNTQRQNISPDISHNIQNRPGTARIMNVEGRSLSINKNQININSQNNLNSTGLGYSPSKVKFIKRVSSQREESFFNVGELNSWDNSRVEENSHFEVI